MRLIVITGFLGSGKTTFLTKLAGRATQNGLKVGILVNEVGEIGIDDQFMKKLGLNVWEILGGCVCCSLTSNLISTIETLEKEYQVDVVLVEPSGAADPKAVISTINDFCADTFSSKSQIAIIDALRIEMLVEVLLPLTTSTIENADMVLINKSDVASLEQIDYAVDTAKNINNVTQIHKVIIKNDLPLPLWKELDKWIQ